MRIALIMDGNAVPWQRAGSTEGRKFTPREVVKAQKLCAGLARVEMGRTPPHLGAVRLSIECVYDVPPSWPADVRSAALTGAIYKTTVPDVDNISKLVMDALNNVVWRDDGQVAELAIKKRYGLGARCSIIITSLADDQPMTPGHAGMVKKRALGTLEARQAPSGRAKAKSQPDTPLGRAITKALGK